MIDALISNPLGTLDTQSNNISQIRYQNILSNIRNPEWIHSLKAISSPTTTTKTKTKSKSKKEKLPATPSSPPTSEKLLTTNSAENTPLIDEKDKKKKEKKTKTTTKKEKATKTEVNYQVIDAIIGSPISIRLPESYLNKYKVNPPSPLPSPLETLEKTNEIPTTTSILHLAEIVHQLHLHHAAALLASVNTTKPTPAVVNQIVHQERPPVAESTDNNNPKPRVLYRYMDEQGHVLAISSTPPSQLREQPSSAVYQDRQIRVDDERRHPLPQYEHRPTWQGERKLPTTVTREDLEMRDKRIPQLTDQIGSTTPRTIPVSYEQEPAHQSRLYHYPNQPNVKLAWLPLSYQSEVTGYETDSTLSERSGNYRSYDYAPTESHYRPMLSSYHRTSGPQYYPPPPPLPYMTRRISPDYGQSRNYLEVFRGGDPRPSEVYSLPLNDYIQSGRSSRYDQYQSDQSRSTGPVHIPSPTVYYTHRTPPHPHQSVQNSPFPPSTVRQSKSFDYRPLRTKLQREYKITPNLLVEEWDYPSISERIHYSTATSTTNRSGVSSPDDVFLSNRTSTG